MGVIRKIRRLALSGIFWRILLFIAGSCIIIGLLLVQSPEDDSGSLGSNVLVFSVVNITVLALLVLAFLVGRNVVKLIFERRQGLLGSKLRTRLVGAFLLLLALPMSVSFVAASGLLSDALEGWFSGQVESAVAGAVAVAKENLAQTKDLTAHAALGLQERIRTEPKLLVDKVALARLLDEFRKSHSLFSLQVLTPTNVVLATSENAASALPNFREPRIDLTAFGNLQITRVEERGSSQFVRTYLTAKELRIAATHRIVPEITQAQATVNEAYQEYEQLRMFRHPLKTSYLLTLALVNLLALFGATWVAFFIAKQLTDPMQRLAEGTQAVAGGNYDFTIRKVRDDEMGFLVQSFNSMIRDLKLSREEASRHQRSVDTILHNLAVGVISLDLQGRITSFNKGARLLFSLIDDHTQILHRPVTEVLETEALSHVMPMVKTALEDEGRSKEVSSTCEFQLSTGGRERLIVLTVGQMRTEDDALFGIVLIFDDITEITKAQHHAAWRDVARRIAHEIKNPLTPIQLSAQRLERLTANGEFSAAVKECSQTIVEHVGLIKRLADEFTKYARMPTAEFVEGRINEMLSSLVLRFAENYPTVSFQLISDTKAGTSRFDPEQLRALFINLLDNAVAAILSLPDSAFEVEARRVIVKTSWDSKTRRTTIEVTDNGPGIPASDHIRVFEPYYSTKSGGTGLGLAIVSSIVLDHQGEVRVTDNAPRGAKFTIILPEQPEQPQGQRRFV